MMWSTKFVMLHIPRTGGTPWITFYFNDAPSVSRKPQDARQYVKVWVIRGGSWINPSWLCRAACRYGIVPSERRSASGGPE
jgi:hypothetical protein